MSETILDLGLGKMSFTANANEEDERRMPPGAESTFIPSSLRCHAGHRGAPLLCQRCFLIEGFKFVAHLSRYIVNSEQQGDGFNDALQGFQVFS